MVTGRKSGVLLACLLLAACAQHQSQSASERFAVMPPVDEVVARTDWYRPTVRVQGVRPRSAATAPLPPQPRWFNAVDVARHYASLQVVVLQRGALVAEWYGEGATAEQRYDSQSMSRAVLSLALGAALADGALPGLDTPLERFLPEWRGQSRGRLTVEDLLYSRSGFLDPPFELQSDNPALQLFIGEDLERQLLAVEPTPGAAPGRGAALEAQMLGLILERATGEPYARYLSRRLWRAIGAGDAFVRLDRPGGHTRTLCCLQATARDWAKVGQLVLDQGVANGRDLLPRAWIERLRTPNPLLPSSSVFWFVAPTPLAPRSATGAPVIKPTPFARPDVFFAGGRGGLRVYVIPSLQAVVVRIGRLRYDFDDGAFLNPFLEALAS